MASPGCFLSVDSFNQVSLACAKVSPDWEELAKYLNIDRTSVLRIIAQRFGRGTVWCLDELLTVWLRRQPSPTQPKPSWRILCDAVSNIDRSLSEKIWTDHTSGCSLCRAHTTKSSLFKKEFNNVESEQEGAEETEDSFEVHSKTESILQTETTASIKSTNNGHGQTRKLEELSSHDKGRGKKRPPEPPGDHLAIVITNTYKDAGPNLKPLPGVEIDRKQLYETFNTARNFTLKFAEDCDEKGMRTLGRDISNELKREHRYQSVFIIFSGHGGKEGMDEALILWTNDGKKMYADDFIQKYKNYIIEGRHGDIPKYFLIDSCRGPKKLTLKQIRDQDKGGPGDIDDKCLIAYSTEDNYEAKCNAKGSYWIVKVAKRLREVDEMHNEQSVIKAIEKSIDDVKKDPSFTYDQFPCIVKNTILSGGQVSDTLSAVPRDVDPQCQVKGSLPVVHSDPAEYKELLKYLSSIPVATELHTFCSNLCLSPAKCQEIFKDPTIKGDFDAQRHRVLQLWRNTKKPTWGDFVEALDSTGFKDQAKEIADIKL